MQKGMRHKTCLICVVDAPGMLGTMQLAPGG